MIKDYCYLAMMNSCINREERFVARVLGHIEFREHHNDFALEFIDKHPEFATIIKEVKYIDV